MSASCTPCWLNDLGAFNHTKGHTKMKTCKHTNFHSDCRVGHMEDSGRFMLEVTIHCVDCKKPFQFLGLQPGLDFDGARVSLDGLSLNVGICPQGVKPTPLDGFLRGFNISKTNQ